jgi:predicted kinase
MNIDKLKEPYILILVGPPLVGKSTWIKNNFKDREVTIISRDQIVMDVYGSENYDEAFRNVNQKEVNQELESRMVDANENGDNVIVDMTNLTSKRRRHTLSYFDDEYTKIAVIFPPIDWEEMQKRNNKRKGEENKNIPESILKSMMSSYQSINSNEGFDKVVSL